MDDWQLINPVKDQRSNSGYAQKKRWHHRSKLKSRQGGAALEYILVTTFAALASLAALAVVGTVMKDQLNALAERLGVDVSIDDYGLGDFDLGPIGSP